MLSKVFCQGHYYARGMVLGVRHGDLIDAYTQVFMIPLRLGGWIPMGLFQVRTYAHS